MKVTAKKQRKHYVKYPKLYEVRNSTLTEITSRLKAHVKFAIPNKGFIDHSEKIAQHYYSKTSYKYKLFMKLMEQWYDKASELSLEYKYSSEGEIFLQKHLNSLISNCFKSFKHRR